jgi:uncharacterized protein YdgA (DUF945 family)
LKRKNIAVAAGAVAVLVAAYPASSWYFGKWAEEIIHRKTEEFARVAPFIKLVQNDYERGLFGSRQTIAIEIPLPAEPPKTGESTDAPKPRKAPSLRLVSTTDIGHGPLFEAGGFRAASATTVLEFDGAFREKLHQAFGGKPPMTGRTLFDFGGGGRFTATVPEFRFALHDKEEKQATLSGEAVEWKGEFDKGMRHVSTRGGAPRFEAALSDGALLTLAGLEFSSDQQLMFPGEPLSYIGPKKISIASFTFDPGQAEAPKVALEKIGMDVDTLISGEFADMIVRLAIEGLRVGEREFGPVAYDYSVKHLRARALIDLNRELVASFMTPELQDKKQLPEAIKDKLVALLLDDARISIDRLSFHLPEGEARFSASFGITGAQAGDFDNPFLLAGKLDVAAELSMPAAAVKTLARIKGDNEEEAEKLGRLAGKRMAHLARMGYIAIDAGTLKSSLALKAGRLAINGKRFNPLTALTQLPEEDEEEEGGEEEGAPEPEQPGG